MIDAGEQRDGDSKSTRLLTKGTAEAKDEKPRDEASQRNDYCMWEPVGKGFVRVHDMSAKKCGEWGKRGGTGVMVEVGEVGQQTSKPPPELNVYHTVKG